MGVNLPDLPPAFLERMQDLLGMDFPAFLESYAQPAAPGLRINTLKLSPEAFIPLSPYPLSPLSYSASGFTYTLPENTPPPGKHPYHAAGLYYLQEPSAQAVAGLLDPQPGERALDLAAAPGGKSSHSLAKMKDDGLLLANEIHPRRAWELAENLERWGTRSTAIANETPARLAEALPGFFDRVLLDAPCSGEGMFRRDPAARLEWSASLVESCARRQSAILEDAARLVRPGGRLAYSTCTFNPDENEAVIGRFLAAHPEFELVDAQHMDGFEPGRPDWVAGQPELKRAVRLWPQRISGEGHFIALLQRQAGALPRMRETRRAPIPAAARKAWLSFCADTLLEPPAGILSLEGSYLYALSPALPDLGRLKLLHPGLWLGVLKKDRFEPAHALALSLTARQAARSASLPAGSPRLAAYLRGESFPHPGDNGWVLVCVDGFPIGWGKRVQGMVKSHYPKGLRRAA